ncbi:hypothetical protein HID58_093013 [Brassica napus]|uniref:Methyltransferase n=1 Tax=Brassica napus TaxID=3708 RepID=A0ABQ7XCG3_BRANA|nr:hypothetical protein HID58_093013 [Brassica napus]
MNVSPESASQFGELVADPVTNELLHYTEKPETFVSDRINCCVYVFTPDIFTAIRLRDVSSQRKDTDVFPALKLFNRQQGGGGARVSDVLRDNSQMKDKTGDNTTTLRFPFTDKADPYTSRNNKQRLMLLFVKTTLALIVLIALAGSFWWTISISTSSSSGHVYQRSHSYRRLQEQFVSDLLDIGDISVGPTRWKELEYCSIDSESYVPCFNVSENIAFGYSNGDERDRFCGPGGSREGCLVLPPVDYKVRTILDIGCGYGSFGAHLLSKHLLTMCIANYEASGSQVQLTLERGLPAMIASFVSKQLPYPSLSFDMLHCSSCGIDWDQKEGLFLVEIDRVLKPGGYFVWTSPLTNARSKEDLKRWSFVRDFAESICWSLLSQQDKTVVWKKTTKTKCYSSRKPGVGPSVCNKGHDVESPYYKPLQMCLGGTRLHQEEVGEDAENWKVTVREYWSLLSPLIFSDHPKRPGDEDPSPPYNMLRNVLDMNAQFGGLNSACEAFPSYPRTYDLVHADNLLSLQTSQHRSSCSLLNIFTEIDRLLRPEGWVIIRDTAQLVETARALTTQLKWEARVIEVESSSEQRLLICQKPFTKRQSI